MKGSVKVDELKTDAIDLEVKPPQLNHGPTAESQTKGLLSQSHLHLICKLLQLARKGQQPCTFSFSIFFTIKLSIFHFVLSHFTLPYFWTFDLP